MEAAAGEVTVLLHQIRAGNSEAADKLIPLVLEELRSLARLQLRRERPDHTLQPTALVGVRADGRSTRFPRMECRLNSSHELWEAKTDLATGDLLGKPRKVATVPGDDMSLLDLTATSDGKRVMVLSRSDQNDFSWRL